jgi:hypothetical protein
MRLFFCFLYMLEPRRRAALSRCRSSSTWVPCVPSSHGSRQTADTSTVSTSSTVWSPRHCALRTAAGGWQRSALGPAWQPASARRRTAPAARGGAAARRRARGRRRAGGRRRKQERSRRPHGQGQGHGPPPRGPPHTIHDTVSIPPPAQHPSPFARGSDADVENSPFTEVYSQSLNTASEEGLRPRTATYLRGSKNR